ncbi:MAG: xylosidase [Syntrophobacteraceae bacterium CG07_land_8_20_14_0_80_61_8]|nr:MAG: xylosidase [Syntrophobacteraceae bacterium CG07_land_8_20_14_0_80_61_8]
MVDAGSIVDKVVSGYQGWFNCAGDGSPIDLEATDGGWRHWSSGTAPAPGAQTFELYPDLSDYPWFTLFPTDYAELGNGEPASLFSSHAEDAVALHFSWMRDYGLDGVALQRFGVELRDPLQTGTYLADNRNAVALMVRNAAEQFGRIFYVMYDVSGMSERTTATATEFTQVIKQDWTDWVTDSNRLNLTASAQYAHQDQRPVVGLWGIGFADRPGTAAQYRDLIAWFHDRGCYVVGGVPRNWLRGAAGGVKPGFRGVFRSLDMIVPWTVGGLKDPEDVNQWLRGNLLPDAVYCAANGIVYQPVLYPGFAWSNWNGGVPNQVPRRSGELFWEQARAVRRAGIGTAYIAMFDEYDEATAIAKAATDSALIPIDQYFLTLSADGIFVSADFYLRLAGRITQMLQQALPPTAAVPIPYSDGPLFLRTGLEPGLDARPTWTDTVDDAGGAVTGVTGPGGSTGPQCRVLETARAAAGNHTVMIAGRDQSETSSYVYFKVFSGPIPVSATTRLSYDFRPEDALARHVAIDLITTDGTTLRDSGARDDAGISMHPGAGRGTVGAWTRVSCAIGTWLSGKTIDRILIAYDHAAESGDFTALIDNPTIENSAP